MKSINKLAMSALVAAMGYSGAMAQAVADEQFFGTRVPSVDEFVTGLKPSPQLRMRGIKPAATVTEAPAVSMQLQFAFDSADLTPESKQSLDNLSAALKSPDLQPFVFMIEGHTDASGPESYNLRLSERRAQSVMEYLVSNHGIDTTRLRVVGKGEAALLDQSDPGNGVNRRVAVVNVGETALGGF